MSAPLEGLSTLDPGVYVKNYRAPVRRTNWSGEWRVLSREIPCDTTAILISGLDVPRRLWAVLGKISLVLSYLPTAKMLQPFVFVNLFSPELLVRTRDETPKRRDQLQTDPRETERRRRDPVLQSNVQDHRKAGVALPWLDEKDETTGITTKQKTTIEHQTPDARTMSGVVTKSPRQKPPPPMHQTLSGLISRSLSPRLGRRYPGRAEGGRPRLTHPETRASWRQHQGAS